MPDVQNVLFVFTDQQRADSLGCYGGAPDTPNLDRLADQGTMFERAYTPTAICTPARAALLSGQHPSTTGVLGNTGSNWGRDAADIVEEPCYPGLLREAGYNVGNVGKWHLGAPPEEFGVDGRHYEGVMQSWHHPDYEEYLENRDLPQYDDSELEAPISDPDIGRLDAALDPRPSEAGYARYLAERSIERIEEYVEDDSPFYMGTHIFGPHRPCVLPREYYEMYDPDDIQLPESTVRETFLDKPSIHEEQYYHWQLDRVDTDSMRRLLAVYRGYATFIDDQVGRLLNALERLGVREETAVVFSTDHGSFMTRHKLQDKGPAMYEDVYNIPLVADVPGVDGPSRDDHFVSLIDLSPTFLDIGGVDAPDAYEGESLLPLLGGEDPDDWRSDIVTEFNGLHYSVWQRMLRTDRYKLVLNPPETDELYDLQHDPHELKNRIDDPDYVETRERLYDRIEQRLEARGDTFPLVGRRFSH